jgi:chromosome segregation ATPase
MRYLILLSLVIAGGFVKAQENETLFAVEYELGGNKIDSYAYSVENCSQSIIHNAWQNWVLSKEGSFNILKKFEANNLHFKNSDDSYKVSLSIVEDAPTKYTIINTLIDQNGMYFSENNPDFSEIFERLKDLSFQTRRACVRNSLKFSNEMMIKLNKQTVDLQTKKGNDIKNHLKSTNELLKLEYRKNLVGEKLDLLENQLERAVDDKKVDALMKKRNKVEKQFISLEDNIETLSNKIKSLEINSNGLDGQIEILTSQIGSQRVLTNNLKDKLENLQR